MKFVPKMLMDAPEYSNGRNTGLEGANEGLLHTRRFWVDTALKLAGLLT
jgi:hypothetical protein